MKLENKVALVTGSSRGVGKAVALGYAEEGAKVVVNYTSNQKAADQVVEEIQALGSEAIAVKADVAQKQEVENLVPPPSTNSANWISLLITQDLPGPH